MLEGLELFNQLPVIPAMSVGLLIWAAMLSMAIDWSLSRILRQLGY
jgi:hypothetical protein